ncbi:TetR family transcriptional regulator C-terminal domain-containing protein [Flexibacterium corallicola]|uniref:TetR family transcriptional regulator C-terminal domain-containing protein n=1 Tax=Flexibacterium corallicola TaxID=3037259 RepID=UPI0038621923
MPRPTSDILTSLADWFESLTTPENLPATTDHGCLLLNTIYEFSRGESDTDQRIDLFFSELRRSFGDALSTGVKLGEINPELDIATKTELLLSSFLGINMMIRGTSDPNISQSMSTSIAQMIREWGP